MNIRVNGTEREIPEEMGLSDLLGLLSVPTERVAVELNREVVRKKDWTTTTVSENDNLEIIHLVGGG